jgi:hypothetical protein
MSGRRIRTEEVLVYLGVRETRLIEELRGEGLFEGEELDPAQAEDLRLAKVLVEDLGVNAAGVEVALHLRRRLMALEHRANMLARALEEAHGRTKPRRG